MEEIIKQYKNGMLTKEDATSLVLRREEKYYKRIEIQNIVNTIGLESALEYIKDTYANF